MANENIVIQASQKNILLVEDEHLLGNLLRQRLEKEGFKVFLAKDGEEALKIVKENKPDLILLDIILPKISGFEFMKSINEDSSLKKMPVIIISNLGQETDLEKGQSLGAVGYFVKARLSIEDLVGEVKKFFSGK